MDAIAQPTPQPTPQPPAPAPDVPSEKAAEPPTRLARLRRLPWHGIILFALTCFAAFLRFGWIDRPALWNDEAHVFRRITGTYQDLLNQLQVDGFGPLHYELYWAMAHWSPPSLGQFPQQAHPPQSRGE